MSELPNLFPALDSATEAALRESIRRFGVLVPVVRDQHGRTLDGHHRSRIADELAVKFRVDLVTVADDEEAREIAATLNADRRQLDAEQRREIVASLREAGHSQHAIAGAVGVSQSTIRDDLSTPTKLPDRITGLDGKSYPAKRPTIVAAKNEREAERAQTALAGLGAAALGLLAPFGVLGAAIKLRLAEGSKALKDFQADLKPLKRAFMDALGPAVDATLAGLVRALGNVTRMLPALKGSFTGLGQAVGGAFERIGGRR